MSTPTFRHDWRRLLFRVVVIGAGLSAGPAFAHSMAEVEAELQASEPAARVTDEPMPDLHLQDRRGAPVRLLDSPGRVIVLSFDDEEGGSDPCRPAEGPVAKARDLVSEVEGLAEQVRFVRVVTGAHGSNAMTCGGGGTESWRELVLYWGTNGRTDAPPLQTILGFASDQMSGSVVLGPSGRIRARFAGSRFSPNHLMLFAAALAHGEHAGRTDGNRPNTSPRISLQLALGGAFAATAVLVYGSMVWWCRSKNVRTTTRGDP